MEQNIITKLSFSLFLIIGGFCTAIAQESTIFFPRNTSFINPASPGLAAHIDINTNLSWPSGGNTWVSTNPLLFNADFKLKPFNSGLGFSFFTDNAKAFANRDSLVQNSYSEAYQFNYNYQFTFGKNILSVGAMAQYKRKSWHGTNPLSVPNSGFNDGWFFGIGTVWKSKRLIVGASLLQTELFPNSEPIASSGTEKGVDVNTHAQYTVKISEDWQFIPSLLFATQNNMNAKIFAADAKLAYFNFAHVGINYFLSGNYTDFGGAYLGITMLKRLQFEYRLNRYFSDIQTSSNLMHGISLRYFITKDVR